MVAVYWQAPKKPRLGRPHAQGRGRAEPLAQVLAAVALRRPSVVRRALCAGRSDPHRVQRGAQRVEAS